MKSHAKSKYNIFSYKLKRKPLFNSVHKIQVIGMAIYKPILFAVFEYKLAIAVKNKHNILVYLYKSVIIYLNRFICNE